MENFDLVLNTKAADPVEIFLLSVWKGRQKLADSLYMKNAPSFSGKVGGENGRETHLSEG